MRVWWQRFSQSPQSMDAGRIVGVAVVDGAADRGVHGRPAKGLGIDCLPNGGFHERGTCEIQAAALGHQQGVAQHRQIAAARDAIAHDRGELGNSRGGDDGVVAEDATEVVLVGKDLFLKRQEHAGGVDEIDQRQAIVGGDPLGTQDLLAGHRKKGAGLHGGVVGDDHHPPVRNRADAGDHPGRGGAAPLGIHPPRRPQAQLVKATPIHKAVNAFPGRQSVLFVLAVDGLLAAAQADLGFQRREVFHG